MSLSLFQMGRHRLSIVQLTLLAAQMVKFCSELQHNDEQAYMLRCGDALHSKCYAVAGKHRYRQKVGYLMCRSRHTRCDGDLPEHSDVRR